MKTAQQVDEILGRNPLTALSWSRAGADLTAAFMRYHKVCSYHWSDQELCSRWTGFVNGWNAAKGKV